MRIKKIFGLSCNFASMQHERRANVCILYTIVLNTVPQIVETTIVSTLWKLKIVQIKSIVTTSSKNCFVSRGIVSNLTVQNHALFSCCTLSIQVLTVDSLCCIVDVGLTGGSCILIVPTSAANSLLTDLSTID